MDNKALNFATNGVLLYSMNLIVLISFTSSSHSSSMESCCIEEFLEGKTIFITGATGYLAKILSKKILRVQPNVKKLYLLMRAPDSNSAKQRFNNQIIKTDLLGVLREKLGTNLHGFLEDKVFPVAGDIACDSLGINSELKDEMCREIDIIGPMYHVLKFAKQYSKLMMLLHRKDWLFSAYVCGEKEGLILEKPFSYGETLNGSSHLDIDVEKKLVEEALKDLQDRNAREKEVTLAMRALGIERARLHGWPNTYSFTKSMREMLLVHLKEDFQLIILPPTIILSTYKEPFPGWIEGMRTMDTFIVSYGKGKQEVAIPRPRRDKKDAGSFVCLASQAWANS
ncbi:probable fatty acyl-CoA reductase 4 [Solanum dulcamara]|uniref:probable fatty acyl-CoA reductase 4 n=1 Tax=Solanum dulcamara TaxID=45834 RepID=UPI002485510D|nr:probable fatty acyl-CoA reductase 4 [Solanum dulcamara]